MRGLFRIFGFVAAACSVLLFVTLTFAVVRKVWFGSGAAHKSHLVVIDLKGMITSSSQFVEQIKSAQEDSNTKGIIVRVNSPGGMVAPSQEMYQAILGADKVKPVYVSMGAVAASGGYYAAVGGRKVFASPGTLTGSVGVIAEFVNTSKLFQWAKVDRFTLKSGKMKDVGSPLREMTKEEREFLQGMLKDIHTEFQNTVKARRKLSDESVAENLDGRVFTGSQAFQAKLVDALGGFEDAALDLKNTLGLPKDTSVVEFEEPTGVIRKILWGNEEETKTPLTPDKLLQKFLPRQGVTVLALAPFAETIN